MGRLTKKEYDYAIEINKPVIPLLHKNPDNLPRDKTETDNSSWDALKKFRGKVEKKHTCVYWVSADELKAQVIVGLTAVIKRSPGIGWVRADQVPTNATIEDLYRAQRRIDSLESELESTISAPPPGTEKLMQDEDEFAIDIKFEVLIKGQYSATKYTATIEPTWNEIFSYISPVLMNDASEAQLNVSFRDFVDVYGRDAFKDNEGFIGKSLLNFKSDLADFHTCIVQLRALDLIRESQKKRSIKDTGTYWQLTLHGDRLMVQLRALHREPTEKKPSGSISEPQG